MTETTETSIATLDWRTVDAGSLSARMLDVAVAMSQGWTNYGLYEPNPAFGGKWDDYPASPPNAPYSGHPTPRVTSDPAAAWGLLESLLNGIETNLQPLIDAANVSLFGCRDVDLKTALARAYLSARQAEEREKGGVDEQSDKR